MKYKLGTKGFKLIIDIEKLRLESYEDAVNVWTIGYGTTRLNGYPVSAGMVINEPVAHALMYGECQDILKLIENAVSINLNQNQVDALVSFAYNIGKQGFISSSLLTAINSKMIINEDLFTRWNKGRVNGVLTVLNGLTKRRKREYQLFTSKEGL